MFKDKELHYAVTVLTNRVAEALKTQNENTRVISSNFEHLDTVLAEALVNLQDKLDDKFDAITLRVAAFEDKLTITQQLQDTVNDQKFTIVNLAGDRDKYQRLLADTLEELEQVGVQLSDEKLHSVELSVKIDKLEAKLQDALKSRDAWRATYESENQLAIGLVKERDTIYAAYQKLNSIQQTQPIQQPQPVQPMGFNMQELASELSKYLNPFNQPAQQADVGSSGLQVPDRSNADAVKDFFARTSGTGMAQNHNTTEHTGNSTGQTSVANHVQSAASLLQPTTYMADPAFEAATQQVDDVLVDNLQFVEPEIASRIKRASGPVQLPSQQQFAYQVAELAAAGEVVVHQLPPAPI